EDDLAGNVVEVEKVQRPGQEKAGSEAGLEAHALLMQDAGDAGRRIQLHAAAEDEKDAGEFGKEPEKNPHGAAVDQRAVPEATRAGKGTGVANIQCGKNGSGQDSDRIQNHPETDGSAPGGAGRASSQTSLPFRRRSNRRRKFMPEVRTRHLLRNPRKSKKSILRWERKPPTLRDGTSKGIEPDVET